MKTLSRACLGMLLAAAAFPSAAPAQDEGVDAITVSGSATVVSDYRFRGFSQSDEEAAIQGGITVSHGSGLYLGTWGRSEEHTSELQSLMRISYDILCLKNKNTHIYRDTIR